MMAPLLRAELKGTYKMVQIQTGAEMSRLHCKRGTESDL